MASEIGLHNKEWLAAGEYTIADMICYPWSVSWKMREIDIEEFPNVKRWLAAMEARPAVQKAMAMGPEFREDPSTVTPEEQARRRTILSNQRALPIPKDLVHGDGLKWARTQGSAPTSRQTSFIGDLRPVRRL